jgi:hypothetical protein
MIDQKIKNCMVKDNLSEHTMHLSEISSIDFFPINNNAALLQRKQV